MVVCNFTPQKAQIEIILQLHIKVDAFSLLSSLAFIINFFFNVLHILGFIPATVASSCSQPRLACAHLGEINHFDAWFRIDCFSGTCVTGVTKQLAISSPLAVYYWAIHL